MTRPAWERTVLDDVAARRPWNIVVKLARLQALLRLRWLKDGVTVVIVNWNTKDITADVIRVVRRLSPASTRILVVDNASTDETPELLARYRDPRLRTFRNERNLGFIGLAIVALLA